MKKSYLGTSIVEAMVVLLIVVVGIVGVFSLMTSSSKLADSTGKRIEAIQIARDGLEAFTSIRDTNWIKFGADYDNCWNTLNYDGNCVGGGGTSIGAGSYIIYKNSDNQFELESHIPSGNYSSGSYRNIFGIRKNNGFYTQSGGTLYGIGGTPFYTREIEVSYTSPDSMDITSIVQWQDRAKNTPQKLEINTTLTNWKAKK